MGLSADRSARRRLRTIAKEFEEQGYQTVVDPDPDLLPPNLVDFHPDLLAKGDHESVVVEVKRQPDLASEPRIDELAEAIEELPGWRFELVVMRPHPPSLDEARDALLSETEIELRVKRAHALVRVGDPGVALAVVWSALEAALRHHAIQQGVRLKAKTAPSLVAECFHLGLINKNEYRTLKDAAEDRQAVAHGYRTDPIAEGLIGNLADMTQGLLSQIKSAVSEDAAD
jgi:hypothetical protein